MPEVIVAPQPTLSPIRAAGRPPISTDLLPPVIGVGGCGPANGGMEQTWVSPATAAGCPTMSTVITPGPLIAPGWVVASPTLAAGGIS
jgi:hypothetical protein